MFNMWLDRSASESMDKETETASRVDASGSDVMDGATTVESQAELDSLDASIGETMDTLLLRSRVDRDAMNVVISGANMETNEDTLETFVDNEDTTAALMIDEEVPAALLVVESMLRSIVSKKSLRADIYVDKKANRDKAQMVQQTYGSLGNRLSIEKFTYEPSSVSFTSLIAFMDKEVQGEEDNVYERLKRLCEEVIPNELPMWQEHANGRIEQMKELIAARISFASTELKSADTSAFVNSAPAFLGGLDLSTASRDSDISIHSDKLMSPLVFAGNDIGMIHEGLASPVVRTFFFYNISEVK